MTLGDRIAAAKVRLSHLVHRDLWSAERWAKTPGGIDRFGLLVARTLYLVWLGFAREKLRLRAAALTYMTLLSLVPALAVGFSLFASFGDLHEAKAALQEKIVSWLSIAHQKVVTEYLDRFVGTVHAGALGGAGTLLLIFTVISLLSNIEKSFNDIWGIRAGRSLLKRFQSYWPMITLGPLLLGVSLAMPEARAMPRLVPLLVVWGGFTMMYAVLPNTKVPFRFALIGGIVAGTLWDVAKNLFAVYAGRAISYSAIYGSLGVVPLSLIWIYISWMIALVGALLTFASQNAGTYEPDQDESELLGERDREHAAVRLLVAVFERFEAGKGPIAVDDLVSTVPGAPRAHRAILDELAEGGLLVEVAEGGAYVPGKPAQATTLADVLRVMRKSDRAALTDDNLSAGAMRGTELVDQAEAAAFAALDRTSVATLLAEVEESRRAKVREIAG